MSYKDMRELDYDKEKLTVGVTEYASPIRGALGRTDHSNRSKSYAIHPDSELIGPGEFVCIAKKTGQSRPLVKRAKDKDDLKKIVGISFYNVNAQYYNRKIGDTFMGGMEVECAIEGREIGVISNGKIEVGDYVKPVIVDIELPDGRKIKEHRVEKAGDTLTGECIGRASSSSEAKDNEEQKTFWGRKIVIIEVKNV